MLSKLLADEEKANETSTPIKSTRPAEFMHRNKHRLLFGGNIHLDQGHTSEFGPIIQREVKGGQK